MSGIKIGNEYEDLAQALAHRLELFASRLGVKPCDPDKTAGGILVYCMTEGPVYDLLEILDKMVDLIEQLGPERH